MGCWNETCMVSHLPICSGDRIVAIPIISNIFNDTTRGVYASDYWSVFLPPVRGTYDDYGGIENVNDPVFESLVRKFTKRDGFFDDFCDATGSVCVKGSIDAIARGAFYADFAHVAEETNLSYLLTRYGSKLNEIQVKVVFIHEDIFDEMISKSQTGKGMWRFIHNNPRETESGKEPDFLRGMSNGLQSCYPSHLFLLRLLSSFGKEEVERRMEEIIRFNGALEEMRMCYHPTTGSGSQAGVSEFAKEMRETISEKAREYYWEDHKWEREEDEE